MRRLQPALPSAVVQLTSRARLTAIAASVTPARDQVPRPASTLPTSCNRAAATNSRPAGARRPVRIPVDPSVRHRSADVLDRPPGHPDRVTPVRAGHTSPKALLTGGQLTARPVSSPAEGPCGSRAPANRPARWRSDPNSRVEAMIRGWYRRPERPAWRAHGGGPGSPGRRTISPLRRNERYGGAPVGERPAGNVVFFLQYETVMPKPLVIVESPAKARTISSFLGSDYQVESSIGHIRDLPAQGRRHPPRLQGGGLGPPGRRRRQRLQTGLCRHPGQTRSRQTAEGPGQGRQRAVPRDRRGPGGRVDRLAPARSAGASGSRAPHGVPRDHPPGARAGRAGVPRPRPPPGRRPGDPPDPRPAVRLRGQPGALEEGHAGPVRRPGAVGRHPAHCRAGAGPHAVRGRVLLGSFRDLHAGERPGVDVRRHPRVARRAAAGHREGLRRERPAQFRSRCGATGRGRRPGSWRPGWNRPSSQCDRWRRSRGGGRRMRRS